MIVGFKTQILYILQPDKWSFSSLRAEDWHISDTFLEAVLNKHDDPGMIRMAIRFSFYLHGLDDDFLHRGFKLANAGRCTAMVKLFKDIAYPASQPSQRDLSRGRGHPSSSVRNDTLYRTTSSKKGAVKKRSMSPLATKSKRHRADTSIERPDSSIANGIDWQHMFRKEQKARRQEKVEYEQQIQDLAARVSKLARGIHELHRSIDPRVDKTGGQHERMEGF